MRTRKLSPWLVYPLALAASFFTLAAGVWLMATALPEANTQTGNVVGLVGAVVLLGGLAELGFTIANLVSRLRERRNPCTCHAWETGGRHWYPCPLADPLPPGCICKGVLASARVRGCPVHYPRQS